MKKTLQKIITFCAVVLGVCCMNKMDAKAFTTGNLEYMNGNYYLYSGNQKVINDFVFDGSYTYYAQADGTPMMNRLPLPNTSAYSAAPARHQPGRTIRIRVMAT